MKRQAITNYKGKKVHGRAVSKSVISASRLVGGIFAVVLILVCSFRFGSFFSSAHGNTQEEPVDYKYYKSVEIAKGDSLWSIAETYMTDSYESVNDYIDELASINNLNADNLDNIQEGDYIMVAYYDTEYK